MTGGEEPAATEQPLGSEGEGDRCNGSESREEVGEQGGGEEAGGGEERAGAGDEDGATATLVVDEELTG